MNKELIIIGILALLLVVSVVEAVQIQQLKSGSASTVNAPAQKQSESTGNSIVPSNLQNLPDMVGGC